ncbi:hypothetical protein BJY04DRAFT_93765 [Aspergillus karnatakaensis]|uniref:C2H2-type zinc finger protein n=1 Tax=Aspergillus karnatakaensis TaxID=1810916 RepID=UPI003CCDF5AC
MSSCRSSFVSILNNDDNPAFAVRSTTHGIASHYPNSSQQYPLEQPPARSTSDYHYGRTYSDSPSPRVMRQPFDPVTEATRPTSPGSSECSYDYAASSGHGSYHHHLSQHDAYGYQQRPEKRLSGNLSAEPPSPQTSIASTSKESVAPKPARKNKYPCPFAASHACTATFTTSGHAARHGKKHTGEKSVHCPICNKAFTRKDNMKQHIRTHRTHSDDMSTNSTPRSSDASREWAARRNEPMYNN